MPSDICPTKDELTEYVAAGREEGERVDAHIRVCTSCRRWVDRLEDALQLVHGDADVVDADEEPPPGLVDRITGRLRARGCWPGMSTTYETALTQTEIVGQRDFAARHGAEAAHAKMRQHDDLVMPIVDDHRGSRVGSLGSVRLMMFDAVRDAARFAIAAQQRLREYNRSGAPEDRDHEIHLRVGIHWARVLRLAGSFAFERHADATRIVGAVTDAVDDEDRILLSEPAAARVQADPRMCSDTGGMTLVPGGAAHLSGFGALRLFSLLWREEEIAEAEPLRLAAKTAVAEPGALEAIEFARGVHCLFINESTGRGYVRPVFSRVVRSDQTSVTCNVECDEVMRASARRAVEAARTILEEIGFPRSDVAVGWWIEGADVYEGASLGLAVALATIAAHACVTMDPSVVVTGSIDVDGRVGRVASIESKLEAVGRFGFRAVVLPADTLAELDERRIPQRLELIPVTTLDEAMRAVLGPALGLPDRELRRAVEPIDAGDEVVIDLWVESDTDERGTRAHSFAPAPQSWQVGDRIRIGARADRDCHLTIVNVGSSGSVYVLAPASEGAAERRPSERGAIFPTPDSGRETFELIGPPGHERIIALASEGPLRLHTEGDLRVDGAILGRAEFEFYVSAPPEPRRSVLVAGHRELPEADYRAVDLG